MILCSTKWLLAWVMLLFPTLAFAQVDQVAQYATIAHRGGRRLAPENTLAAFKAGMATGVDFLELDVHQTIDSVVVVSHDETLDRCTDGKGRIDQMTFAAIRKLDAGSWLGPQYAGERIPTLEEALDLVHGQCGLWIELKAGGDYPGIEKRIVDLIHQKHAASWAEVISFDGEALRKIHLLDSNIRLQKLMTSNLTWLPFFLDTGLHWGSPKKYDFVDGYCYFYRCAGRNIVQKVHRWGKSMNVWTVNDPQQLQKMIRRKVDGIETDDPSIYGTGK
jgi:glycerophosphoryl diester phosphodiesterase